MLTLTGAGGCGKTRLGLQVAADLIEAYPDGVWFVDLAPLADEALVPQAALGALGAPAAPGRPPLAVLTEALRRATSLLVLDNCEHLVRACARLVDAVLRGCPRVTVLATSRELLGIAGEAAWRVPSLAAPDPARLPSVEHLAGYEAVRLFAERAALGRPGFAVTAENAPAVAQICARLDGLPLALELAAARVRVLAPEQIAARLDDRFRLLTGGSRTALRRQQTLRAAVDWSHDLLPEAERALLRRLAVFAGGWTLDAAEAVGVGAGVEAEEVLDVLTQLVDKSLVVAEAPAGRGEARYRLLETVRQYAEEKLLDAGEAAAVRARHRDWFLAWAERARAELRGPDQRAWRRRLDAEHDNLRAALEWSHGEPGGAEAELRLGAALAPYWESRGLHAEGRRRLEAALARAVPPAGGDSGPPVGAGPRAAALAAAGGLAWRQGDGRRARPLLEAAAAGFRALNDPRGLAGVLGSLAVAAYFAGDYAASRERIDEILALARRVGDGQLLARARFGVGSHLVRTGDYAEGRRLCEEALRRFRELGDEANVIQALNDLALAAMGEGDLARARALATERQALTEAAGLWRSLGFALTLLGRLARLAGDRAEARRRLAAGLPQSRDAGDRPSVVVSLEEWGGWPRPRGSPRAPRASSAPPRRSSPPAASPGSCTSAPATRATWPPPAPRSARTPSPAPGPRGKPCPWRRPSPTLWMTPQTPPDRRPAQRNSWRPWLHPGLGVGSGSQLQTRRPREG